MEKYRFKEEVQTAYERLMHPLAIFQEIDNKIVPIVLSDGFCELFGYDDQKLAYSDMNEDPLQFLHPDDVERLKKEVQRFITEGGRFSIIYCSRTRDAHGYKVIRAVGKRVQMENGVYLGHVWYTDDSTEEDRKIAVLQESVASLLANIPAMTFSKDVNTGKYLACNQAFADYAHKPTPEGVVGLTDYEIFDYITAEHFVEDDKKALTMDEPYIFYEDVPDAAGNRRRFQTTKLKFYDASGRECLLGLCQDVTEAMQLKQEYDVRLAHANDKANIDVLTGIRNRYAYHAMEDKINQKILAGNQGDFVITVFDVNNLKVINDTYGHKAGDEYICGACKIICQCFKHSPVFRLGGDEFLAISEGEDFENIDTLLTFIARHNEEAKHEGGIVIACGSSRFNGNESVATVLNRADKKMYENKKFLKKDD